VYVERPPAAPLRDHVVCTWSRTVEDGEEGRSLAVVPDACMDLMWDSEGRLRVAGPDTEPIPFVGERDGFVVGVRFRPGAAPSLLGVPSHELRNLRVDVDGIWGGAAARGLAGRLAEVSGWDTAELLERALIERLPAAAPLDEAVRALVGLAARGASLEWLSRRIGLSERQLRRRCEVAVGYGPKTLDRVLRFQRFSRLVAGEEMSLAEAALAAGYADQAHLTHECRRLSGRTPARIQAEARTPSPAR
jgi:AraC-like DNA-binding protein